MQTTIIKSNHRGRVASLWRKTLILKRVSVTWWINAQSRPGLLNHITLYPQLRNFKWAINIKMYSKFDYLLLSEPIQEVHFEFNCLLKKGLSTVSNARHLEKKKNSFVWYMIRYICLEGHFVWTKKCEKMNRKIGQSHLSNGSGSCLMVN